MSIPLGVGNYLYTLPGNGFQGIWTFYYILQCHNEPVGFSQSDGSTPKHTYLVNCYIWLFCIATLSYFNISRAYIHCRHRNEAAFTTDRCNPNLEKRRNQKVPNECHFTSLLICISCLEVWWFRGTPQGTSALKPPWYKARNVVGNRPLFFLYKVYSN